MIQEATILLVEDDANDVLLMQRAFTRARLANPLQIVRDGDDAIQYLEGSGRFRDRGVYPFPLLVLLDLKLPRKSGFEVLQWIQGQPGLQDLTVVVLTASEEQPDIKKAYQLGAKSYLIKPARLEELVAMMVRLRGYWLLVKNKPEQTALVVDE